MVKSISTQEEVLQIAEKRREAKDKGEKERYTMQTLIKERRNVSNK